MPPSLAKLCHKRGAGVVWRVAWETLRYPPSWVHAEMEVQQVTRAMSNS